MKKKLLILNKKLPIIHVIMSFAITIFVILVMSSQITNRTTFANTEVYQDVMDRWGAPIIQPAPSVRYVESGVVFTKLDKLTLDSQKIKIDAEMNYRKRGLAYFSGFNFLFSGKYSIKNTEATDIDIVFVFPINVKKNQVMLSDLSFFVNGKLTDISLADNSDKLVWTGRLKESEKFDFQIDYKGRGLDYFTYVPDPEMPVKNFVLHANISGGNNFDYSKGVIPATTIERPDMDHVNLTWDYQSLESGAPVGLILPSEKTFSTIISTITTRSWATSVIFILVIILIAIFFNRPLKIYETCLMTACFAFFHVLLAYFAAYMNFYLAYYLSLILITGILFIYITHLISIKTGYLSLAILFFLLYLPSLAVILQGYTGLIYTIEILAGLITLMWLTTRKPIIKSIENQFNLKVQGEAHESI